MAPVTSAALARTSLTRIASQAICTAEQALAVVTEPPATGPGGNSLSPSSTSILCIGEPRISEAVWPITV